MDRRLIRVLCVDDNQMVGDAIELVLKQNGGFDWLGRLDDAHDLVNTVQRDGPDVVLLDLELPGKDPFEALSELAATCPAARVIVMSGYLKCELLDRAVDAGAWGYVAKQDGAMAIVAAIQQVASGRFTLSDSAPLHQQ